MCCDIAATAPITIAGSTSGASAAATSWDGFCGRSAAGRTTRSSPIGRSFLFRGGAMRRVRAEILALFVWGAGIAAFVAVNDIARHVIPQLGAASLVVGLFCAWRRLWIAGTVWTVTAIVALLPIVPNYLPHRATSAARCRLTVVTFDHLDGHP